MWFVGAYYAKPNKRGAVLGAGEGHKIGFTIMILVVLQALAGYFTSTATTKFEGSDEDEVHDHGKASSKTAATTPPKSLLRKVWEIGHHLVGVVLVALSWYNIQDGIGIQERHFETMEWVPS